MKEHAMDERNREEKLRQLLDSREGEIPVKVNSILYRRNRIRLGIVLKGLGRTEQARAVYSYFANNDPLACKQHCYLATKLVLSSVGLDGGPGFETANHILYALLSDNVELINAISHVETPVLAQGRETPTTSQFYVYMLQLAMRGDDEALRRMIMLGAKKGNKKHRDEFAAGKDFFSLLLAHDQAALEELIQNHHAKHKNSDPITEDFIAFTATLEAKLCWYRGIPVQINHPLVPMELMPIDPLANYDDMYDFLKPGWVPPPQGFFANLVRRMAGG